MAHRARALREGGWWQLQIRWVGLRLLLTTATTLSHRPLTKAKLATFFHVDLESGSLSTY